MSVLAAMVASWIAADASPLAIGQHTFLGLQIQRIEGTRSPLVWAPRRYGQTLLDFSVRAGASGDSAGTDLGSQLGIDFEAGLAIALRESDETGTPAPFRLRARPAMTFRAFTFNTPTDGMLCFRLGPELVLGGATWWAGAARLSINGGVRLALAAGSARAELDYELVPWMVADTPAELSLSRVEHRLSLAVGVEPAAMTAGFIWSDERSFRRDGPRFESGSLAFVIGVEYRK